MEIKFIVIIFSAIIEAFIGLYVFIRGNREPSSRFFAIFAVLTGLWVFTNSLTDIEFWTRTSYCVALFLVVTGLLWVENFSGRESNKYLYRILYGICCLFGPVLYFTDSIVYFNTALINNSGEIRWAFGNLYFVYSVFFLSIIFFILFFIHVGLHRAKGAKKSQLTFVFAGAYLFAVSVTFIDFILPLFGIKSLINYDSLASLFFVGFSAYAILKHHLFDIKLIAVESLSLVISLIFFSRLFIPSSGSELMLNIGLFVFVVSFSVLLVRGVMKDIKDRERVEQLSYDLVVANEQLRQMDRQKSDFVSIASHQLRTPLTAVKGYASLLIEGSFGVLPKKTMDAVSKIFESSQQMVMIIENFLTVSRIEQGRMFYKFETLDLQKITGDMVKEMQVIASGYGIRIRFYEEKGITYPILGDFMKIKQVVHNLLDESIRHTPKGLIDMFLSFSQNNTNVVLAISDTGEGATKKHLKQMFEKYEPDASESGIRKETGVELFIVKEIVKAHKGKIWAESEGIGKGLTVFVELPVLHNNPS